MINERTSPSVAKLAGRILKRCEKPPGWTIVWLDFPDENGMSELVRLCTVRELKSICASALTQAPDKRKKSK